MRRFVAVVAAGFLAVATGLIGIGLAEAAAGTFGHVLADPGVGTSDMASFDRLAAGAFIEAAIAVVLAVAVLVRPGRPVHAIAAIGSVLALGTGLWMALAAPDGLVPVAVGPLTFGVTSAAALLAIGGAVSLVGAALGFAAATAEPPLRPVMPPPTHQA